MSQMSPIPCHSSKGGAGGDPAGRTGLYAALNSSYLCRFRTVLQVDARAQSWLRATCNLYAGPQASEALDVSCLAMFQESNATAVHIGIWV